ncbi:zinc ribbon domain-containing protein [Leptolyngbya sp. PCC 6406]|uniref:zinc ribbon domain-containing protein n=1 Tax=Leptolyngbya sp. PCC 6406 TaxID=1173264 RepID=UPI0002ACA5EB|nr:zinc ribbon domain-containing protein [Leptolyngbya sp. PCC 6406]
MPSCPRCQTPVQTVAIQCPHCGLLLKAHGHPGIPLHQTLGSQYLCADCAYHADDSCTFPQRPQATTCTLYQSVGISEVETSGWSKTGPKGPSHSWTPRLILRRYGVWISLVLLLGISFFIALSSQ